ncbi:hypothetical protein [Aquaspirillum serpens]|uniref:hypothetical protein n=1 Tax=Aquaspirillum serpens TaxID=190 RepID=UPI0003B69445|nr:hypothetical protein [Aquaspirillum serpens]
MTVTKLVKQRKESIRIEKVEKVNQLFSDHIAQLQSEIFGVQLIVQRPNFGGEIKGLKTLSSIQNALDTALASAKIEADAHAKAVREKLAWYRENAAGYLGLFVDLQQLILKPMEDFKLTIADRIETHKKAEAERLEAERERIRQEEIEKLATVQQTSPTLQQPEPVEVALTRPIPEQVTPNNRNPTLKLGVINDRLGFSVTADFLRALGFEPQTKGSTKLYHEEDFPAICRAIMLHIQSVANANHHLKHAA